MTETKQDPAALPGIALYRKKPAVLPGLLWDGANRAAVEEFAVDPDGGECFRWAGSVLELWNDQETTWIPCPVGHVVMRGVLGEFYPVSPQAVEATYEPAGDAGSDL